MKKRIGSLLLSGVLFMSLTPPIKALENDDLLMSAQGWECIVQRIEEERDPSHVY